MTSHVGEGSPFEKSETSARKIESLARRPADTERYPSVGILERGSGSIPSIGGQVTTDSAATVFRTNDPEYFSLGATVSGAYDLIVSGEDTSLVVVVGIEWHTPFRSGKYRLSAITAPLPGVASTGTPLWQGDSFRHLTAGDSGAEHLQTWIGYYRGNQALGWGLRGLVEFDDLGADSGSVAFDAFSLLAIRLAPPFAS
jgi:hypothetical protein